jgi:transcriptional regulator with XRE-family HTH domain
MSLTIEREKSLGQRLLAARKRLGVTRRSISELTGISEICLLRTELIEGHRNYHLVQRQLERILKILEAKIRTEERVKEQEYTNGR